MKPGSAETLSRDLYALYCFGTVGGSTDEELLVHFTGRDSAAAQYAFEVIVHRHGPMVLGVCRRVLRDEHIAEDAFQATFLVLALKAETIRQGKSRGDAKRSIDRAGRPFSDGRSRRPWPPGPELHGRSWQSGRFAGRHPSAAVKPTAST